MPESSNPPEGTDIPLHAGVANSPRWGVLAIIVAVVAVLIGAVAFTVARGDGDDGTVADSPLDELWGNRWEVVDVTVADAAGSDSDRPVPYEGSAEDWLALLPMDGTLTVEFGDDRSVSYTGCNGGFGTVAVDGSRLRGLELGSTDMGCMGEEGEALMAWDWWFGRLLSDGVEAAVDGDRATLTGTAGSVELRFGGPIEERDPVDDPDAPVSDDNSSSDPADGPSGAEGGSVPGAPSGDDVDGPGSGADVEPTPGDALGPDEAIGRLVGVGRWEIVGVEGPDGPPLDPDEPPVLAVERHDGRVIVTISGCNGAGADFRIEGDRLRLVEELPHTEMACEDDLMQQDEWFRSFLRGEPRVDFDTGDHDGLVVLVGGGHRLLLDPT